MNILKDPMLQQQAEHLEIGRKGEAWVTAREREKLSRTQYSNAVEASSNAQRSSFDIKSRTIDGNVLYIEVKTTEGVPENPFYMSAEEYAFAEHCMAYGIPYELHRVHFMNDEDLCGEVVYSAEDVVNLFDKTVASYVLKEKSVVAEEAQELPAYLPWEDCADRIPGTRCQFYLAKIEGPHPEYRFERHFLHGKYEYQADRIWLSCEIESTGVYEVSMVWTDVDGNVLQSHKDWFLLVNGKAYDLERCNVLDAVEFLKRRVS